MNQLKFNLTLFWIIVIVFLTNPITSSVHAQPFESPTLKRAEKSTGFQENLPTTSILSPLSIPQIMNQITESPPLRRSDEPEVRQPGQVSQEVNRLEKRALTLYEQGEIEEAKEIFNEILELNPNHLNTLNNLGNLHYRSDEFSEALEYYEVAAEISENVRPYFFIGLTHQQLGNRAQARENLQIFINQSSDTQLIRQARALLRDLSPAPETPSPPTVEATSPTTNYEARARQAFKETNFSKAADLFQEAIENQDGNNIELLMDLASTYFRAAKYSQARDTYQRILDIEPGNALAFLHLGVTLSELGNTEKAIENLQKAKKLRQDSSIAQKAQNYLAQLSPDDEKETQTTQQTPTQETADQSQEKQTTSEADGSGTTAAEALAQQKGKTEEEQLEEVLEESEQDFSLLGRGTFDFNYSFSYSFTSSDQINVDFQQQQLTQFNIERDATHSANHSISINYGALENLNFGLSIPIVQKFDSVKQTGITGLGDIGLSTRWQPFASKPGKADVSFNASVNVPTGKSSFEIDADEELSTGGGFFSLGAGVNVSKAMDPVLAFAGASLNHTFKKHGLQQQRGNQILTSIAPGQSLSVNFGMSYNLSYTVSLTMQYQQSISLPSTLEFENTPSRETNLQNSQVFQFNTGWRVNPEYIVNVGVGMGLTEGSPDATLNFSIPVQFR